MTGKWSFDGQRPIYAQMVDQIKSFIAAGTLSPGEKLPAVRELAAMAGVNPNTVQRAMAELEREGLACAQRTSGRYVTEDRELIDRLRQGLAAGEVKTFLEKMEALGLSGEQTLEILKKEMKK